MNNEEIIKSAYFFSRIKNLGNVRIKNILDFCIANNLSPFHLETNHYKNIEGITENLFASIKEAYVGTKEFDSEYDKLISKCEKEKIKIISIYEDEYPSNLKTIYNPPVLLYIKGKLNNKDKYSLSIVGTRYPSEYGKNVCEKISDELSELKIPLISGMARGIDSISHKSALKNNNITYAVLGCGVDVIYPKDNEKLYHKIIDDGSAVISEFPLGTGPDAMNFPARNRIISGISLGAIIIESGLKGGSMITANFALDQNREVFSVPGYIYSKKSEGCNELIKKGQAKLITAADDVIKELSFRLEEFIDDKKNLENAFVGQEMQMSVFEKKIFDSLDYEPKHIDSIIEITGLSISDCLVNLLSLEFKNLIKQIPGKYFHKI